MEERNLKMFGFLIIAATLIATVTSSGWMPVRRECSGVDCPAVTCVNPVYSKGLCCGKCVPRPGAKCDYGEEKYKSGDTFKLSDMCNECNCFDGLISCTDCEHP